MPRVMIAMLSSLSVCGAVSNIGTILLDASNLQFSLRPGLSTPSLCSMDFAGVSLPERLDRVAKLLKSDKIHAVFDGRSFEEQYAGEAWDCDPEIPDATRIHVSFTGERESADDILVQLAQEIGSEAASPSAEIVTTGSIKTILEQPMTAPKPVFGVTLLKSAAGKGKRDKREAFLKTCGLMRMGDTVHLPAFEESQQQRSLALMRGLHSLERGIVRVERLNDAAALVVTDDRGLRRRCFQLANPPVVFGRAPFFNWMERLALEAENDGKGASEEGHA